MADSVVHEVEMNVRITLSNDTSLDAAVFPLASHKNEHPIDNLDGFLNKRTHDFFPIRQSDGTELLLPLSHCVIFELSYQNQQLMKAVNPAIAEKPLTADPDATDSYAPAVLTLVSGRVVRGEFWFHTYEPHDMHNIYARLNGEERFICLHGSKSTIFIRRQAVLKAQHGAGQGADAALLAMTSHPEHVTEQCGLIDESEYQSLSVSSTEIPVYTFRNAGLTPDNVPGPGKSSDTGHK